MAVKNLNTVKLEKKGGIGWIIFNRPEKRNAMSPELHFDMNEALDRMDRTSGGKFTYSHSSPTTVLRRVGRL